MNDLVTPKPNVGAAAPKDEQRQIRACALYFEELLSADEFTAISGLTQAALGPWLTAPDRVRAVNQMRTALLHDGSLARIEAARGSRQLMQIALRIANNEEASLGVRLDAVKIGLKAAGADEPPSNRDFQAPTNVRIHINLGDPAHDVNYSWHDPKAAAAGATIDGEVLQDQLKEIPHESER